MESPQIKKGSSRPGRSPSYQDGHWRAPILQSSGVVPRRRVLSEVLQTAAGRRRRAAASRAAGSRRTPRRPPPGTRPGPSSPYGSKAEWRSGRRLRRRFRALPSLRRRSISRSATSRPLACRRASEARRDPAEVRLLEVEQVRELVEPDVVGVVRVLEALLERGHREDHGPLGMGLAARARRPDVVVAVEVVGVEQHLRELVPLVLRPADAQRDRRGGHQQPQLVRRPRRRSP